MRIEELDPDKFYAVIIENEHASSADLEHVAARLRERGANVVVLTDNSRNVGTNQPPRYWGLWRSLPKGGQGWMRDSSSRFLCYPHPAIAQAHIITDELKYTEPREFTLEDFANL